MAGGEGVRNIFLHLAVRTLRLPQLPHLVKVLPKVSVTDQKSTHVVYISLATTRASNEVTGQDGRSSPLSASSHLVSPFRMVSLLEMSYIVPIMTKRVRYLYYYKNRKKYNYEYIMTTTIWAIF